MTQHALADRTPAARIREARRQLLERGEVDAGLVDDSVGRSWRRSHAFGLAPTGRMPGAPHASAAQLARAIEQQHELVAHARPVMQYLCEQTCDDEGMVILADANGMLLQALGEASFVDRAQRVALRPGASWHEQWRGTNAIGTALAEATPVTVRGGEHYLERNGFLTCTAAPIVDPAGRVLGVLDVSGDQRGYHRHTLALVRSAARMIEHRLFDTRHAAGLRLRLHEQPEGIGTLAEGLIALSEDGWIVGADASALAMLGLGVRDIGARTVEAVLQIDVEALCRAARAPGPALRPMRRSDGQVLWARIEAGRSVLLSVPASAPRAAPAQADDALAALDTGDLAMQAAVERARRVADKAIALLLQGESGAGKEVFARALHASSTRRDGPFVAVNCAAVPETLIEA